MPKETNTSRFLIFLKIINIIYSFIVDNKIKGLKYTLYSRHFNPISIKFESIVLFPCSTYSRACDHLIMTHNMIGCGKGALIYNIFYILHHTYQMCSVLPNKHIYSSEGKTDQHKTYVYSGHCFGQSE